ncbi:Hypothetical sugar permease [Pseudoalteromonas luteoviolacea B = ATCC 29581]|nr:Hypothetical sugar permease [Pseudoalteromonas luteoviolacea B = ATCC 29581]
MNRKIVLLVIAIFFVISFITNVLGPIFPQLIETYSIGLTLAGFFPFAFFAAYGVMSIPAGLIVQHVGEKITMLGAFLVTTIAAFVFALVPTFWMAMLALFAIGTTMAFLQVAINPLLRISGGSEHFTFLSVLAQLAFGLAGVLSPLVYRFFISQMEQGAALGLLLTQITPEYAQWVSMYWLFGLLGTLMVVWILLIPIDKAKRQTNEHIELSVAFSYFRNRTVMKFFFAIVCYVALEQGIANSISVFLQHYHDVDPKTQGAAMVSQFWLFLTIGCVIALPLLKLFDAQKMLMVFCIGALLCLVCGVFSTRSLAVWLLPSSGLFLSIMWSVTVSLGLNSVAKDHGTVAGILCTGIVGGAIASPIIGLVAASTGSLKIAMCVLLLPLGYLLYVAVSAKPLVKNHTLSLRERFKRKKEISA